MLTNALFRRLHFLTLINPFSDFINTRALQNPYRVKLSLYTLPFHTPFGRSRWTSGTKINRGQATHYVVELRKFRIFARCVHYIFMSFVSCNLKLKQKSVYFWKQLLFIFCEYVVKQTHISVRSGIGYD